MNNELPPLPPHPESRILTWSDLEREAIATYGALCAQQALEQEREERAQSLEDSTRASLKQARDALRILEVADRELLELAAKVAGFSDWVIYEDYNEVPYLRVAKRVYWRPLTDDGDALRLAVALRLNVHIDGSMTEVEAATLSYNGFFTQSHIDDPCAATRRAIVRAAAALGAQQYK
jgi:hypothetical protein